MLAQTAFADSSSAAREHEPRQEQNIVTPGVGDLELRESPSTKGPRFLPRIQPKEAIMRSASLLVLLAAASIFSQPVLRAEEPEGLRRLFEQLNSDLYHAREEATRRLIQQGAEVVEPLVEYSRSQGLEVWMRTLRILHQMALLDDEATAQAARKALDLLARDAATLYGQEARRIIRRLHVQERERALARLQQLGARFVQKITPTGMVVSFLVIDRKWKGTKKDLRLLGKLDHLQGLALYTSQADDSLVPVLSSLHRLQAVQLYGTRISEQGLLQLRRVWPPEVQLDVRRGGFLGVQGSDRELRCVIQAVQPGSAAEKAGLRPLDVVIKADGKPVTNFRSLTKIIAEKVPGDRLELVVLRQGKTVKLTAVLGSW